MPGSTQLGLGGRRVEERDGGAGQAAALAEADQAADGLVAAGRSG